MNLTADDYARMAAELKQTSPCCRGLRHIHAMAKEKRTQELRYELELGEMLARCLEEDIAEFGDD